MRLAPGSEVPAQKPKRHRWGTKGGRFDRLQGQRATSRAWPGWAGAAHLRPSAPPALTHFPFRPRRKQSPPPRCIGRAAEGGLSRGFARGRVSRDRAAVERLARPVNPEQKFLLVLARAVKNFLALLLDKHTEVFLCPWRHLQLPGSGSLQVI